VSKLDELDIYAIGKCYMSVCAPAEWSVEDVVTYANILHPSHRWGLANEPFKDGSPNPCWCDDCDKKRKHYLLNC
jgi:hypothetical protein